MDRYFFSLRHSRRTDGRTGPQGLLYRRSTNIFGLNPHSPSTGSAGEREEAPDSNSGEPPGCGTSIRLNLQDAKKHRTWCVLRPSGLSCQTQVLVLMRREASAHYLPQARGHPTLRLEERSQLHALTEQANDSDPPHASPPIRVYSMRVLQPCALAGVTGWSDPARREATQPFGWKNSSVSPFMFDGSLVLFYNCHFPPLYDR